MKNNTDIPNGTVVKITKTADDAQELLGAIGTVCDPHPEILSYSHAQGENHDDILFGLVLNESLDCLAFDKKCNIGKGDKVEIIL